MEHKRDDEDEGNPVCLKMILQDIIFNTKKQITEVRSIYRSTNAKHYSQQTETRPI